MTGELDILALSEEIDRDSKSGVLSKKLLSQGNILYGVDPNYPDLIMRTSPNGTKAAGHWCNGEFFVSVILNLNSES